MDTFIIAYSRTCDKDYEIVFIDACSKLDAIKIFAKDYFDFETINNPKLGILDIQDMFLDSGILVSEPI